MKNQEQPNSFIGNPNGTDESKARTNWLFSQRLLQYDLQKKQFNWRFVQLKDVLGNENN